MTLTRGLVALLAGVLAGCSSGFRSDAPAPQTYVLRVAGQPAEPLPEPASVQVLSPLPRPGFETDRIMLVRSDRRLDHFNAIRWAGDLPEVVEALAVERLRGSGAFSSVHDSISGFPADYLLQISIRRFEADYTRDAGAPRIHVVLDCTLGRRSDRRVVASFEAEGVAEPQANRVNAVIDGFERAAATALDALAAQTLAALRTVPSPSTP